MNLLTNTQITKASEDDLRDTLRALNRRMDHIDEQIALNTARQTLADHGISDALQLRFDVEEWEAGYFYSPVVTQASIAGHEVELPQVVIIALEAALDEPLRELGHNGPSLGRRHHITIDLALNALSR